MEIAVNETRISETNSHPARPTGFKRLGNCLYLVVCTDILGFLGQCPVIESGVSDTPEIYIGCKSLRSSQKFLSWYLLDFDFIEYSDQFILFIFNR